MTSKSECGSCVPGYQTQKINKKQRGSSYELRKAIRAHTETVRRVKYASMKETSIDVTPDTNRKAAD